MTRIPIEDDNNVADRVFHGDEPDDASSGRAPSDPGAPGGAQAAGPGPARSGTSPGAPGAAEAGSAAELRQQLQQLQAERDDLYQRFARATADFKNTQRRLQTESDQRTAYANQSLIKSLLPVIDNFERALAVDPSKADVATILKGMQIVHDQWLAVLKQQNVEEIAPEPGTPFDPNQHEALMQQDAPQYREPTVVKLLQKGYSLHDRTLRPAQVVVSKTN